MLSKANPLALFTRNSSWTDQRYQFLFDFFCVWLDLFESLIKERKGMSSSMQMNGEK
jgi:hypothetical protein